MLIIPRETSIPPTAREIYNKMIIIGTHNSITDKGEYLIGKGKYFRFFFTVFKYFHSELYIETGRLSSILLMILNLAPFRLLYALIIIIQDIQKLVPAIETIIIQSTVNSIIFDFN